MICVKRICGVLLMDNFFRSVLECWAEAQEFSLNLESIRRAGRFPERFDDITAESLLKVLVYCKGRQAHQHSLV